MVFEKKKPMERVFDTLASLFVNHVIKILIAVFFVFLGILISWKAEKGACLFNCNFQSETKNYYLNQRESELIRSEVLK